MKSTILLSKYSYVTFASTGVALGSVIPLAVFPPNFEAKYNHHGEHHYYRRNKHQYKGEDVTYNIKAFKSK